MRPPRRRRVEMEMEKRERHQWRQRPREDGVRARRLHPRGYDSPRAREERACPISRGSHGCQFPPYLFKGNEFVGIDRGQECGAGCKTLWGMERRKPGT